MCSTAFSVTSAQPGRDEVRWWLRRRWLGLPVRAALVGYELVRRALTIARGV